MARTMTMAEANQIAQKRIEELEAENKRLREALKRILNRSYKMSPIDNFWVQDVLEAALSEGVDDEQP